MICRQRTGIPVETGAVVQDAVKTAGKNVYGKTTSAKKFEWTCPLAENDAVYGLGENTRGINKRGFRYTSWCSDETNHNESTQSLYGAHNFIIVRGKKTFGIFFDTPSRITFDLGWTDIHSITVSSETDGIDVYYITPEKQTKESSLCNIVRQFRTLIGTSYIPPLWGFGYQQSRWGYRTEKDVLEVRKQFRKAGVPLDGICLDIDYMEDYESFTIDKKKFPDMKKLSSDLKSDGIRLIPIIDAGIKIKDGYKVYEDGKKNGYFCKKTDGTEYCAGVWPGRSNFPDFTRKDVRAWFGAQYKNLTDAGIEGFWNDMNEPAMFYSDESLAAAFKKLESFSGKNLDINCFFDFCGTSGSTFNRLDDYKRFYNEVTLKNGRIAKRRHDTIHNIYGSHMTRAANEGLSAILPGKRTLLYSRASCIGSHRWGGIWTGDNKSWWSHILMELKMLPSLNMCGFMYSGADTGGYADDSSEDLLLRWTALGVFTPLLRNHSAWNTKRQEFYQFEHPQYFKSMMQLRYSLIPYMYSEYVQDALSGGMFIRPLAFDYPDDSRACHIEDQLMVCGGLMIAPVYEQNADGRMVYLPEKMTMVRWHAGKAEQTLLAKGDHYIEVPVSDIVFFVKHSALIPLCRPALSTDRLDTKHLTFLGNGIKYDLYEDDGFTTDIKTEGRIRRVRKEAE